MSKKIKIMNPRPDVSDSEIDSYMNFPELLRKRDLTNTVNQTKWWIRGGGATLIIAALSVWYVTSAPLEKRPSQAPSVSGVLPLPSHGDAVVKTMAEPVLNSNVAETRPAKVKDVKQLPKETINAPEKKIKTDGAITGDVYIQAEPVEGYEALYGYLNSNIKYPHQVTPDSIQGFVTVTFVIEKNGSPARIEATSSMPEEFNAEAIRLIQNMPAWKPATLNGDPVPSKLSLPVTFQIRSFQKK